MLIDLPTLALLFAAAFIAGLVDAVAGGGGLITVPALLAAGLPPQMALGTNKLQATFGSGSAMLHFIRAGRINLRECSSGIIWTAIGAGLGAWSVQLLDPGLLRRLISGKLSVENLDIQFPPGMEARSLAVV